MKCISFSESFQLIDPKDTAFGCLFFFLPEAKIKKCSVSGMRVRGKLSHAASSKIIFFCNFENFFKSLKQKLSCEDSKKYTSTL